MGEQLTPEEKQTLLRLARQALETGVRGKRLPPLDEASLTPILRAEGASLAWLPGLRAALLAVAVAWSTWLGWSLIKVSRGNTPRRIAAGIVWLVPLAMIAASWWLVFFIW